MLIIHMLKWKGSMRSVDNVQIQLDIPQLFKFYNEINASALGNRIGMDKTLISQYINGHKMPGQKQIARIIKGIKDLGEELSSLELA